MPELMQHLVVTLVALSAAWVVLRRVVGTFSPVKRSGPGCPSCATGNCAGPAAPARADAHGRSSSPSAPLRFHRTGSSGRTSQVARHKA